MNTEDIVISLIEDFKFASLLPENPEQRKTFLAILAAILVSKTHNNYLDEILSTSFKAEFKNTHELEFLKRSHRALFDELKANYQLSSSISRSAFNALEPLIQNLQLKNISPPLAVDIYERTLQRLQKMNVVDRSSRLFQYDYFPPELAQFVAKVADRNKGLAVCDTTGGDGKLAIMTCSFLNITFAAVSCEQQSPTYVAHMLAIAGVYKSVASECIKASDAKFDLTILLQPEPTKTEELINTHITSLSDNGLCIALVGQGLLVGKQHLEFRRRLLAGGLVKAVIELPAKLLSPATPALFALLLSKGEPTRQVIFESYSENCVAKGRVNSLNVDEHTKPEFSLSVSSDSIPTDSSNLTPKSYLQLLPSASSFDIPALRSQLTKLQEKNDESLLQLRNRI